MMAEAVKRSPPVSGEIAGMKPRPDRRAELLILDLGRRGGADRTPPALQARIAEQIRLAFAEEELQRRYNEMGAEWGTPFEAAFGDFLQAERRKWSAVVSHLGGGQLTQ
ncbi:hypothetical protein [Roseococcus sp. YIM B11640]|uniref:hypothetical protein n=1 Tax=Roseococcus sp. YIM B11640 TaxID=3133973 RepID=UPI003C7BE092